MAPKVRVGSGKTGGNMGPAGFTLLEMLVALTVVSVAAAVFAGLFGAALGLSRSNENLALATELAETRLAAIQRAPQDFVWGNVKGTARIPITTREKEPPGGYPVQPPDVMLVTRQAQQELAQRYGQFRWVAFARLVSPDASAYELTVAIRWMEGAKPRALALTSAMARGLVDRATGAQVSASAPAPSVPAPAAGGNPP